MVRGPNLHRGRKVEDDAVVVGRPCSPPSRFHGLTYLNREIWFGLRESLRTVLVSELSPKFSGTLVGQLAGEFRMLDGQFDRLLFRVLEYDLTERGTSSVIHVQDCFLAP